MSGQLFTASVLDKDGRQLILDDAVRHVHYYSTAGESWDKSGTANQSWFRENFVPNDSFDSTSIAFDRWAIINTAVLSDSIATQENGVVSLAVEKDEGIVALTSEGKWKISGDFELRLYVDWDYYYNEYRAVTHTYLKVGVDNKNSVRVSFKFDGVDFSFVSQKTVNRDLVFFDWKSNGDVEEVPVITEVKLIKYFKIMRVSGTIKTFISDGVVDTQVGEDISDTIFLADTFVEFGVESKEYNVYRSAFTKIVLLEGVILPVTKFFSSVRGVQQGFPERALIVVDDASISIIDEQEATLWMRFLIEEGSLLLSSATRVHGCNGVLYCTTLDGLLAFDFHQDKIFKYKGNSIFVADEPIMLRNTGITFKTYISYIGNIPDNNIHDVSCKTIGVDDYVAFTNDSGVAVIRALASGVATNIEGPLPGSRVEISDRGALFWSGFDPNNNDGELSFFSNITALTGPGASSFNRTGFYGAETALNIFGSNIEDFDVRTVSGVDLLAVGTTEGITFVAYSPGTPFTKSVTYGIESPAVNPIKDPSFENYLGLDWKTKVSGGFHENFIVQLSSVFSSGEGETSLLLNVTDLSAAGFYEKGMSVGVYQDVDLTGLSSLYFDIKLEYPLTANENLWDLQIVVDGIVLKSYKDEEGNFTKFNDSVNIAGFVGVHTLEIRLKVQNDSSTSVVSGRKVYIDNIRTAIGNPDFRIMPTGNSSVKEVLLQYDTQGHKIYFSSIKGYGAIDLDDNSLDYFILLNTFGPDNTDVLSSEFSRIENEV